MAQYRVIRLPLLFRMDVPSYRTVHSMKRNGYIKKYIYAYLYSFSTCMNGIAICWKQEAFCCYPVLPLPKAFTNPYLHARIGSWRRGMLRHPAS